MVEATGKSRLLLNGGCVTYGWGKQDWPILRQQLNNNNLLSCPSLQDNGLNIEKILHLNTRQVTAGPVQYQYWYWTHQVRVYWKIYFERKQAAASPWEVLLLLWGPRCKGPGRFFTFVSFSCSTPPLLSFTESLELREVVEVTELVLPPEAEDEQLNFIITRYQGSLAQIRNDH